MDHLCYFCQGGDSIVVDFLFIVTQIMGVCICSIFCCTLLNVHSGITIILMGKRELVALLGLSSWCFVMVKWLSRTVPWDCLWFVNVVFFDHTHLLFLLCFLENLFIDALCSPTGKRLTAWLSFVMSNCKVFTLHLVPWVMFGA